MSVDAIFYGRLWRLKILTSEVDSRAQRVNVYDGCRALCCLFRPDTDGARVSKCGQLSQQTRGLDPMLFQCWSSAVGGGPILKQHWVRCSRLLGSTQVSVYTHPSATIIFSPADQGTFSKTAGQSQAYYNTWNWERGDIWRQPSAHFNMRRSSV